MLELTYNLKIIDFIHMVIKFAFIRHLIWPSLFLFCILAISYGFYIEHSSAVFAITYFLLGLTLWQIEIYLPFEHSWLLDDGQSFQDLAHTIVSKLFTFYITISMPQWGLTDKLEVWESFWPTHWPLFFQVVLGLVIAEFGFYWAHRTSHEWPPMWRFHAVHHSVTRLWFFNTGRFHLGDTFRSMIFGLPLLFMVGTPTIVLTWVSAITAIIGLLTHCNIDMDNRYINWLVNTPNLHRWHHSKNAVEGNANYGENLMLWDWVFGTYYMSDVRPPKNIGINEFMPKNYLGQVLAPIHWQKLQKNNLQNQ